MRKLQLWVKKCNFKNNQQQQHAVSLTETKKTGSSVTKSGVRDTKADKIIHSGSA